jgi:hypothetical protein
MFEKKFSQNESEMVILSKSVSHTMSILNSALK